MMKTLSSAETPPSLQRGRFAAPARLDASPTVAAGGVATIPFASVSSSLSASRPSDDDSHNRFVSAFEKKRVAALQKAEQNALSQTRRIVAAMSQALTLEEVVHGNKINNDDSRIANESDDVDGMIHHHRDRVCSITKSIFDDDDEDDDNPRERRRCQSETKGERNDANYATSASSTAAPSPSTKASVLHDVMTKVSLIEARKKARRVTFSNSDKRSDRKSSVNTEESINASTPTAANSATIRTDLLSPPMRSCEEEKATDGGGGGNRDAVTMQQSLAIATTPTMSTPRSLMMPPPLPLPPPSPSCVPLLAMGLVDDRVINSPILPTMAVVGSAERTNGGGKNDDNNRISTSTSIVGANEGCTLHKEGTTQRKSFCASFFGKKGIRCLSPPSPALFSIAHSKEERAHSAGGDGVRDLIVGGGDGNDGDDEVLFFLVLDAALGATEPLLFPTTAAGGGATHTTVDVSGNAKTDHQKEMKDSLMMEEEEDDPSEEVDLTAFLPNVKAGNASKPVGVKEEEGANSRVCKTVGHIQFSPTRKVCCVDDEKGDHGETMMMSALLLDGGRSSSGEGGLSVSPRSSRGSTTNININSASTPQSIAPITALVVGAVGGGDDGDLLNNVSVFTSPSKSSSNIEIEVATIIPTSGVCRGGKGIGDGNGEDAGGGGPTNTRSSDCSNDIESNGTFLLQRLSTSSAASSSSTASVTRRRVSFVLDDLERITIVPSAPSELPRLRSCGNDDGDDHTDDCNKDEESVIIIPRRRNTSASPLFMKGGGTPTASTSSISTSLFISREDDDDEGTNANGMSHEEEDAIVIGKFASFRRGTRTTNPISCPSTALASQERSSQREEAPLKTGNATTPHDCGLFELKKSVTDNSTKHISSSDINNGDIISAAHPSTAVTHASTNAPVGNRLLLLSNRPKGHLVTSYASSSSSLSSQLSSSQQHQQHHSAIMKRRVAAIAGTSITNTFRHNLRSDGGCSSSPQKEGLVGGPTTPAAGGREENCDGEVFENKGGDRFIRTLVSPSPSFSHRLSPSSTSPLPYSTVSTSTLSSSSSSYGHAALHRLLGPKRSGNNNASAGHAAAHTTNSGGPLLILPLNNGHSNNSHSDPTPLPSIPTSSSSAPPPPTAPTQCNIMTSAAGDSVVVAEEDALRANEMLLKEEEQGGGEQEETKGDVVEGEEDVVAVCGGAEGENNEKKVPHYSEDEAPPQQPSLTAAPCEAIQCPHPSAEIGTDASSSVTAAETATNTGTDAATANIIKNIIELKEEEGTRERRAINEDHDHNPDASPTNEAHRPLSILPLCAAAVITASPPLLTASVAPSSSVASLIGIRVGFFKARQGDPLPLVREVNATQLEQEAEETAERVEEDDGKENDGGTTGQRDENDDANNSREAKLQPILSPLPPLKTIGKGKRPREEVEEDKEVSKKKEGEAKAKRESSPPPSEAKTKGGGSPRLPSPHKGGRGKGQPPPPPPAAATTTKTMTKSKPSSLASKKSDGAAPLPAPKKATEQTASKKGTANVSDKRKRR